MSSKVPAPGEVALFEDYLWLLEGGESAFQAARRCGRTVAAITKAAERAGRVDVARHGYGELAAARRDRSRR